MKKLNKPVDPEMQAFEEALLRSIDQVKAGQYGTVHTPEMIEARRRGRPTGSVKVITKQPTTLRLDPQTLESWRATGKFMNNIRIPTSPSRSTRSAHISEMRFTIISTCDLHMNRM